MHHHMTWKEHGIGSEKINYMVHSIVVVFENFLDLRNSPNPRPKVFITGSAFVQSICLAISGPFLSVKQPVVTLKNSSVASET